MTSVTEQSSVVTRDQSQSRLPVLYHWRGGAQWRFNRGIQLIKESLAPVFDDQRCWTSILLVISEAIAVINTGVPGSTSTVILPYLDRIGLQVADIDFIENTQGHGDHIGSNESLRRFSSANLLVL